MKLNYQKYRKHYAAVMLLSYLLLVSLSIFHYHHVDLQEGNFKIESGCTDTGSNPFDKEIDLTHECTIQLFTHSVLDYNFKTEFNIVQNRGEQEFSFNEIIQHPSNIHYYNNPLRAPPSV